MTLASTAGPIRLLDLGGLPGLHTQAVYHVLAEGMRPERPDSVVLTWPTDPYVCLGYHQRLEQVLDLEAAAARGLPVVRRRVGGGLTYLDEDQVFYQFVFHHRRAPRVPRALYAWLLRVPVRALEALGVAAELTRVNEVEVGSRRIAGIGAGRIGEASVVVGNVLLDFDFDAMIDVWPRHTRGFHELAADALRLRITTLRREGVSASRELVIDALREQLAVQLGREVVVGELTAEEEAALEPMVRELAHPSFVHLHADERPAEGVVRLKISARAFVCFAIIRREGIEVRAAVHLRDEEIVRARIESAPPRSWDALEASLCGRAFAELEPSIVGLLA